MTDENTNGTAVTSEQRQTSQTSTADIAAASIQHSGEASQATGIRVPGEPAGGTNGPAPLLTTNEIKDLHSRWTDIQAGFVD